MSAVKTLSLDKTLSSGKLRRSSVRSRNSQCRTEFAFSNAVSRSLFWEMESLSHTPDPFPFFSIRVGGKCLRTRGVETGLWPWPAGLHPLKSVRGTQTWGSPGCWCRCRYRCPFCLHLQRCVFWCVCSSGRSAWSACCTPGKQIASRPCECAGASGARLTWWNVCRKKASCTQRASRRCATSDALWGETFSRRLYRSPGCDSYEVLSSVGWRPQARAAPPPGSSGSRMWPVRSISWTTWTRSRCPSWRRIS